MIPAEKAHAVAAAAIHVGDWQPALRRLPDDRLVAAIGDVHGRADLLVAIHGALAALLAVERPADAQLIHLGDLVDRGPEGARALRLARDGVPGFAVETVIGNHEDRLLDLLGGRLGDQSDLFFKYGGDALLVEFGIEPVAGWEEALRQALGAPLIAWLKARPRLVRIANLVFVHAGIDPSRPLDDQDPHDLAWIRRPFLDHAGPFPEGVGIVHGHTPTSSVQLDNAHRINLDTGAYASGRLSALVIRGDRMRLVSAVDTSEAPTLP